jgi:hypothetical protein
MRFVGEFDGQKVSKIYSSMKSFIAVLVFLVIYDGVDGARIAIFDQFAPDRWNIQTQRKSAK